MYPCSCTSIPLVLLLLFCFACVIVTSYTTCSPWSLHAHLGETAGGDLDTYCGRVSRGVTEFDRRPAGGAGVGKPGGLTWRSMHPLTRTDQQQLPVDSVICAMHGNNPHTRWHHARNQLVRCMRTFPSPGQGRSQKIIGYICRKKIIGYMKRYHSKY